MKIRTSFVTNSSSYSSAEIKIENPVLLEILEKYRKKGAFDDKDGYDRSERFVGVSIRQVLEESGQEEDYLFSSDDKTEFDETDEKPLAFFFYENEMADIFFGPESLDDVAACILRLIWDENSSEYSKIKNRKAFQDCKKEMELRSDEIKRNYNLVSWQASNDGYGEAEPEEGEEIAWEFYYEK